MRTHLAAVIAVKKMVGRLNGNLSLLHIRIEVNKTWFRIDRRISFAIDDRFGVLHDKLLGSAAALSLLLYLILGQHEHQRSPILTSLPERKTHGPVPYDKARMVHKAMYHKSHNKGYIVGLKYVCRSGTLMLVCIWRSHPQYPSPRNLSRPCTQLQGIWCAANC